MVHYPLPRAIVMLTSTRLSYRLFTPPQLFSETTSQLGEGKTFAAIAAELNLSSTLDNTPRLTSFIPTDAAVAAAGAAAAGQGKRASTNVNVEGHVVHGIDATGRVGYTPYLEDGTVLKTLNGLTLTITKKGENFYVNDALVTKANVILNNGVAHYVDKVCCQTLLKIAGDGFQRAIPVSCLLFSGGVFFCLGQMQHEPFTDKFVINQVLHTVDKPKVVTPKSGAQRSFDGVATLAGLAVCSALTLLLLKI